MKQFLFLPFCLLCCGCLPNNAGDLEKQQAGKVDEAARQAELQAAELDRDKQKSIWDAEHITFELEWRFGPRFKAALKDRDSRGLVAMMRDGFEGRAIPLTPEVRTEPSSGVRESRFAAASDVGELDADQLVNALLEPTRSWQEIESVGLRVLHIDQMADDEQRWSTHLLLTREGVRDQRRVFDSSKHLVQWTIASDEQLEDQAVIDQWTIDSASTLDGANQKLFAEVTSEAGLDRARIPDNWNCQVAETQQYRFGVAVEDFNRDGYLDIAVAVYGGEIQLLQGSADLQFREVSRELGVRGRPQLENFVAAWIDYNNDDFPDLLMSDRLYRNEAGQKFVDVTRESELFIHDECMGATVADYDGDGQLDLYLLYQRDWTKESQGAEKWVNEDQTGRTNELWRNIGGRFRNVSSEANAGSGRQHTHSAAWFYYDDDHFPDLYVANDFGKNVLLRNKGDGSFEDVSEASATGGFATSMGVATGDLNNDGLNEIYVSNMFSKMGRRIIAHVAESDYPPGVYQQILGSCAGNQLYTRSSASEPFVECGEARGVSQVGWAFAPAFADFNNDGLLDIYSTTGFMSFQRSKPDG